MRRRKPLLSLALFVVIAGVTFLSLRPRTGLLVALRVLEIEAIQVLPDDSNGPGHWAATFEVTNLTSTPISFVDENTQMKVKLAEGWSQVHEPPSFGYMYPQQKQTFVVLVPQRTEVCRFFLECVPDPLADKAERFFAHRHASQTGDDVWVESRFAGACRWVVDHLPQQHRHLELEVKLPREPTTTAPTANHGHKDTTAVDAGMMADQAQL
jgi:hypothetical protein